MKDEGGNDAVFVMADGKMHEALASVNSMQIENSWMSVVEKIKNIGGNGKRNSVGGNGKKT